MDVKNKLVFVKFELRSASRDSLYCNGPPTEDAQWSSMQFNLNHIKEYENHENIMNYIFTYGWS